jgi:hypothetical protein
VIRLGEVMGNRLFTIPIGLDLMPMFVEAAASITVGEDIGIIVLKRILSH